MGVRAFERYHVDGTFIHSRERFFVLPPFPAQRFFPLIIGFYAVAVTNVNSCFAGETSGRTFERDYPPLFYVVHKHVESGFIELNDVGVQSLQLLCFLV